VDKFDILIIGGGPAAITIAKTIQNKMTVGIIRPEDHSMLIRLTHMTPSPVAGCSRLEQC